MLTARWGEALFEQVRIQIPNQLPSITLTTPASGTNFTAPANIELNATATDLDGSIAKVEFYNGNILLNSDSEFPYSYTWENVVQGSYVVSARAYDNTGATTSSANSTISVGVVPPNQLPTVTLTSPVSGSSFTTPGSIVLSATAADADGSISKVEFYNGATLLNSDLLAPFTFTWSNVLAGTYAITARAYDNLGASKTSAVSSIVVVSSAIGINGTSCIAAGSSNTFVLNPGPNATAVNWWSNGDVTITPDPGNPYRITLKHKSSTGTFQVYCGVNYSVSPWYKEYSKSITIGNCSARAISNVSMSPFPSTDEVVLESENDVVLKSVRIINSSGQTIYAKENINQVYYRFSPEIPAGVYFISIVTEEGELVKQFIKTE
jgi:hypothetical protein